MYVCLHTMEGEMNFLMKEKPKFGSVEVWLTEGEKKGVWQI